MTMIVQQNSSDILNVTTWCQTSKQQQKVETPARRASPAPLGNNFTCLLWGQKKNAKSRPLKVPYFLVIWWVMCEKCVTSQSTERWRARRRGGEFIILEGLGALARREGDLQIGHAHVLPPHLSQPALSSQRARDKLARSAGELIAVAGAIGEPGKMKKR